MKDKLFFNDRLRLSLTDVCNFKCFYCSNEGQAHNCGTFIENEFVKKFFTAIKSEDIYIKKINLTGGEPLLHNKVIQITRLASNICENITINTNGSLLTIDMIDELINSGANCIKFGVDNPLVQQTKPVTNKIGFSAYKITDLILYAVEKIPRSSLNIVVTRFNYSYIPLILEWVISNRIDRVEFIELIEFDFANHKPMSGINHIDYINLIRKVSHIFEKIEYNESLAKYLAYHHSGLVIQFAEDFCNHRVCANLWTRVEANGSFAPCIKGADNYPINFEKTISEQLVSQLKMCCNGLNDYIPRNNNGILSNQKQIYTRSEHDYFTDQFTELDL